MTDERLVFFMTEPNRELPPFKEKLREIGNCQGELHLVFDASVLIVKAKQLTFEGHQPGLNIEASVTPRCEASGWPPAGYERSLGPATDLLIGHPLTDITVAGGMLCFVFGLNRAIGIANDGNSYPVEFAATPVPAGQVLQ